jgi:UDP-N-acetylmuramate--alanine ligase
MSGLAEVALAKGHEVSGSDMVGSAITDRLVHKGARFWLGHDPNHVDNAQVVVYTAAAKPWNPELVRARDLGLTVISRAEMLGQVMKECPHSVAVAGSHGKTTTTSMVTAILEGAGLCPTALVGGEMAASSGNVQIGSGGYFVTEACEYEGAFLRLRPEVGIILNVDLDHVDFYRDFSSIARAFGEFGSLAQGCLVGNGDDPEVRSIIERCRCETLLYSMASPGRLTATDLRFEGPYPTFTVLLDGEELGRWRLRVPGRHNVYNALASAAACVYLGVPASDIQHALEDFTGALRRFEVKGESRGVVVVDDYAHHPAEISATLKAARLWTRGLIWCVFQPHTFSRTRALLDDFAQSLKEADRVVISDIYAAREENTGEVSSLDLVRLLDGQASYGESFQSIADMVTREARPGDLVLTMGAGDIHKVGHMILKGLAAGI